MITLFTMGFGKKNAHDFFEALRDASVRIVVDVRLNNVSQLAGFTKRDDLRYFLREIGGIGYEHKEELAPTKDILDGYRKGQLDWDEYTRRFCELMRDRRIEETITPEELDRACLLCSEPHAEKCHRRLVAEYLKEHWLDVSIHHL